MDIPQRLKRKANAHPPTSKSLAEETNGNRSHDSSKNHGGYLYQHHAQLIPKLGLLETVPMIAPMSAPAFAPANPDPMSGAIDRPMTVKPSAMCEKTTNRNGQRILGPWCPTTRYSMQSLHGGLSGWRASGSASCQVVTLSTVVVKPVRFEADFAVHKPLRSSVSLYRQVRGPMEVTGVSPIPCKRFASVSTRIVLRLHAMQFWATGHTMSSKKRSYSPSCELSIIWTSLLTLVVIQGI